MDTILNPDFVRLAFAIIDRLQQWAEGFFRHLWQEYWPPTIDRRATAQLLQRHACDNVGREHRAPRGGNSAPPFMGLLARFESGARPEAEPSLRDVVLPRREPVRWRPFGQSTTGTGTCSGISPPA